MDLVSSHETAALQTDSCGFFTVPNCLVAIHYAEFQLQPPKCQPSIL